MSSSISHHREESPSQVYAAALAQQQEDRRTRQADALGQLDCLHGVPHEHLVKLAEVGVLRAFMPGTVILHERAPCEFVYVILRGTVSLTLHNRNGQTVLIGMLNRGDCFSEGPLFGDLFRGASVTAETTCYLLQMPRERLHEILPSAPEMSSALRKIYRRRLIEARLVRCRCLAGFRLSSAHTSHRYCNRGTTSAARSLFTRASQVKPYT